MQVVKVRDGGIARRVSTIRTYTRPTTDDRTKALNLLPTGR
ncbi:MAG: hypothetical protein ACRDRW_03775 [Pseudonocardiaceae bacterium]